MLYNLAFHLDPVISALAASCIVAYACIHIVKEKSNERKRA